MTDPHFPSSAATEVQLPLSTDMVLTAAREVRSHLDGINKPYSSGVVGDCIAEIERLQSDIEKLKDPVAVHINMLRGGIAKPTWANIKHLYPEQFPDAAQAVEVTDDELYRLAVEAWESQTSHEWYPDAMDAVVLAIRERLAAQPPAAPVETKTVYVKRWRTLVKLPAKYADEIVEALRHHEHSSAGNGAVKSLAWGDVYAYREDGGYEVIGWEADSGFGIVYGIDRYFASDSYGWEVSLDYEKIGDFDDPEQAKAAAQADYEKRVLAALMPHPPQGARK